MSACNREPTLSLQPMLPLPRAKCRCGGRVALTRHHLALHRLMVWDESVRSPSFPNLTAQYRLHQVVVRVKGLPKGEFMTSHGVEAHYWEWRKDSLAEDIRFKEADQQVAKIETKLEPTKDETKSDGPTEESVAGLPAAIANLAESVAATTSPSVPRPPPPRAAEQPGASTDSVALGAARDSVASADVLAPDPIEVASDAIPGIIDAASSPAADAAVVAITPPSVEPRLTSQPEPPDVLVIDGELPITGEFPVMEGVSQKEPKSRSAPNGTPPSGSLHVSQSAPQQNKMGERQEQRGRAPRRFAARGGTARGERAKAAATAARAATARAATARSASAEPAPRAVSDDDRILAKLTQAAPSEYDTSTGEASEAAFSSERDMPESMALATAANEDVSVPQDEGKGVPKGGADSKGVSGSSPTAKGAAAQTQSNAFDRLFESTTKSKAATPGRWVVTSKMVSEPSDGAPQEATSPNKLTTPPISQKKASSTLPSAQRLPKRVLNGLSATARGGDGPRAARIAAQAALARGVRLVASSDAIE